MTWKQVLQRQIYRLQKIAGPASLGLLALNLTFVAYPYVAWRDINPYLGTAAMFGILVVLLVAAANVYTVVLQMHVAERRAVIDHDPTQVYAFVPFQAMMVLHHAVPSMRCLSRSLGDEDLARRADELESWALQGYIPRTSFPASLAGYYPRQGGRV